ncbi:MAG: hypothetical protein U0T56_07660 [Ferruginibacter sp.]
MASRKNTFHESPVAFSDARLSVERKTRKRQPASAQFFRHPADKVVTDGQG